MILSDELLQFCIDHETIDVHALALQANKHSDVDIPAAIQQIKGRQIARKKLPLYYNCNQIIYPPHLALEQCSSEETAIYKQELISVGDKMIDLTGGFGVDFSFLAKKFKKAVYVERQETLSQFAVHNFKVLGLNHVEVKCAGGSEYLQMTDEVDFIYIDPSRRSDSGKRTVLIEDCTPNLVEMQQLLEEKGKCVMIKLSPMLDISLALKSLRNIAEVHIVSVDNEVKELLFINRREKETDEPVYHCINLTNKAREYLSFVRTQEKEVLCNYSNLLGEFLYEPNASIMKAGAFNVVGRDFSLKKLHPNSHLYTSSVLQEDFPGRKFKVKAVSGFNKKELKNVLTDVEKANIATRNFPLKAEELKKRLGLADGGCFYIFGTTLSDDKRVIVICEKIE